MRGRVVVLCAGAIHSPAILMRSGIGPADGLRAIGITPLYDAPGVGQNLGEHASVTVEVHLRPEAWASSVDVRPIMCLVRYSSRLAGAGRNDMQIYSINPPGIDEGARGRGGIRASVMQTFSKGSVRLTTSDPTVDPEVDFRLLSDRRDLVRLRDGVQRLFELARHPAIASITEHVWVGKMGQAIADFRDDTGSMPGYGQSVSITCMRPAPAVWGRWKIHRRSSIRKVACEGWKGSGWSMRRSCRTCRVPIRT